MHCRSIAVETQQNRRLFSMAFAFPSPPSLPLKRAPRLPGRASSGKLGRATISERGTREGSVRSWRISWIFLGVFNAPQISPWALGDSDVALLGFRVVGLAKQPPRGRSGRATRQQRDIHVSVVGVFHKRTPVYRGELLLGHLCHVTQPASTFSPSVPAIRPVLSCCSKSPQCTVLGQSVLLGSFLLPSPSDKGSMYKSLNGCRLSFLVTQRTNKSFHCDLQGRKIHFTKLENFGWSVSRPTVTRGTFWPARI